jgi:phosphate transport system substrate-binding protein
VPAFRTDGSGTTFIFTNYLSTQSEEYRETIGSGTAVKWPTGQGGKGNEGVTQIVQSTPGAIGYVELIYAVANKIPYALVANRDGNFVKASPESVALAGESAAEAMKGDSLAVPLWNQPGKDVYPIAAFTYLIVYKDLSYLGEKSKAEALLKFMQWATTEGQSVASGMGYAPLSPAVRERVGKLLGTLHYSGEPIGGK